MNETIPAPWIKELARLKRRKTQLASQDNLIVFYGSSSIRLWVKMQEDLAPFNTLNLGFGGSSFKWCLYFFDELFEGLSPSRIVLYAGENDLTDNNVAEVKAYYDQLLTKIQATYPSAQLSQISLKPSPTREDILPELRELNTYFQQTMARLNGVYINIHEDMLTQKGATRPELFLSDGLHMNREGYKIWAINTLAHLQAAN